MSHPYSENHLVEQPAIGLFVELGWQTVWAMEEVFGADGTFDRETSGEVVLLPRLRSVLKRLNPTVPPEAIATAIEELSRDRSAMSARASAWIWFGWCWPIFKNKAKSKLLVRDGPHGGRNQETN